MDPETRSDNTIPGIIVQDVTSIAPSSSRDSVAVSGEKLTNASPMHVAMVDGNGDQITSFGGGTQYTLGDDTYTEATSVGTLAGAVRNDTLAALADTDNEIAPLQVDANGGLYTNLNSAYQTSSASFTDVEDALTFTLKGESNVTFQLAGTWSGVVSFEASNDNSNWIGIWAFQAGADTFVQASTANGIFRCTTAGFGYVRARFSTDTSGTVAVTGFASHNTSGIFQNFPIYGTQYLGKQEDTAHSSGDVGVPAYAVRNDTLAALAGTDGDYAPLQVNATGALYIQEGSALDVSAATVTVDLGANNDIQGDVAHDGEDANNPVKIGGRAQDQDAQPDEVADNDRVDALFDRNGRLAVWAGAPFASADINDSTSGNNTIVAATSAKKIRVLSVLVVSDGTVDVRFEDGADGTALTGQIPLQAREGFSIANPFGLFECSSNTLLNLELSANVNVHGFVTYILVDD